MNGRVAEKADRLSEQRSGCTGSRMNNQQNDDMDRQTLNVAFATQKGGSGKTAITVLVAGYLHYRLGCPLAVIDCDFPQYSLYEMRERDSRAVLENEYLKRAAYEQMRQPGRAAYPVRKCRVEQAPDTARELAAESCYDLLSSTCRAR